MRRRQAAPGAAGRSHRDRRSPRRAPTDRRRSRSPPGDAAVRMRDMQADGRPGQPESSAGPRVAASATGREIHRRIELRSCPLSLASRRTSWGKFQTVRLIWEAAERPHAENLVLRRRPRSRASTSLSPAGVLFTEDRPASLGETTASTIRRLAVFTTGVGLRRRISRPSRELSRAPVGSQSAFSSRTYVPSSRGAGTGQVRSGGSSLFAGTTSRRSSRQIGSSPFMALRVAVVRTVTSEASGQRML